MTTAPPLNLLELFAGYGGLGIAVEAALNARTTTLAEFDDAPSKILAARFPDAPNLHDVTTAQWGDAGHVDVISGGSPCQDISGAGRRAGMVTGSRSGLWVSMRDAIADRRPRFVVWENVRAATTARASSEHDPDGKGGRLRALGRVLGDLAELGYDAEWVLVRAADVGACHQRARVFLLAWDRYAVPALPVDAAPYAEWSRSSDVFQHVGQLGVAGAFTDKLPPNGAMRAGHLFHRAPRLPDVIDVPYLRTPCAAEAGGGPLSPAQATAQGRTLRLTGQVLDLVHPGVLDGANSGPYEYLTPIKLLPTPAANLGSNGGPQHPDKRRAGGHSVSIEDVSTTLHDAAPLKLPPTPAAADAKGARQSTATRREGATEWKGSTLGDVAYLDGWGEYLPAVIRHALALGYDEIPAPTEPGAKQGARPRLAAPFVEYMMGLTPGWVTDPNLGLTRSEQLKALGNGVVPQQAEAALRHMLKVGLGRDEAAPRVD